MAINENGKYTKLTDDVVNKLEQAISLDATVDEACFYANISKQTYYNWIEKNPKMGERFDQLRQKLTLKARQVVADKIDESYSNAMDYLKRKKRKERE
jgi:predicted DNA-binding protein YlxM (UPF0122 family)